MLVNHVKFKEDKGSKHNEYSKRERDGRLIVYTLSRTGYVAHYNVRAVKRDANYYDWK